MQVLHPKNTALFLCDIQDKLGSAIYEYPAVVGTALKMVKIAKIMSIPVLVTEQHPKGLGNTASELRSSFEDLGELYLGTFEKQQFGMITPDVDSALGSLSHLNDLRNVILCGIEAHICVLQTAIDLIQRGYSVYVLADGVSSCNKEELPTALNLIRQVGAFVTTSESIGFRLLGSAANPAFKAFAALIREEKDSTANRLKRLCPH